VELVEQETDALNLVVVAGNEGGQRVAQFPGVGPIPSLEQPGNRKMLVERD
jgi:hypothetical protein